MSCHCGSGESFENCCELYILRKRDPKTAADLMRSRYSAFVVGAIDYIYETHLPQNRKEVSKDEIRSWSQESEWLGLNVISELSGSESDQCGEVEFVANYANGENKYSHHERASFEKRDGRWFFVDGKIIKNSVKNPHKDLGRNDPCFCGSGKKYKKCCLRLQ